MREVQRRTTGFDPPDRLDAFLDAVRWGTASTADARNVQSLFRSGIDIEDYQLDLVFRAIQMPRVDLLIADDLGRGQTGKETFARTFAVCARYDESGPSIFKETVIPLIPERRTRQGR